jgi:endonuclease/exonuclease/phosphatase (EEP) superfamily protein YafD
MVVAVPESRVSSPSISGRRKRRLPGWIAIILWMVIAALAVVAAMRLFAWDAFEPFAVLNTVTEFVYLPAWIVALVAVIGRRLGLALAALVIVVLQIVFMAPELTASEALPSWVHAAPTVHLLDANVYSGNPSMAGYAKQILATHPDLVTMEEANPHDVAQLTNAGALRGLPYRIEIKRYDPFAFLVASKYPLTGTHIVSLYGRPLIVQTTIRVPSGPQRLWVVHTVAPLPVSFSQWQGQLSAIQQQVKLGGTTGLLIVGDFNSTWGNKGFRGVLADGLTDGAAARGEPFDMTWSQLEHPLPPLVRIDHVLTGADLVVTTIHSGPGPGSDHRDLSATIAIRP